MKIRILRFKHPNTFSGDKYCCVCKDICFFTTSKTDYNLPTQHIKDMLLTYLHDNGYTRLVKMGWKLSGNSIIPPIFVESELVEYASDFFKIEITNYQIVELNVEINESGD